MIRKKKYVCGFLKVNDTLYGNMSEHVILLRKQKPDWQKGKLNGVGGKMEPGEEPLGTMRREWEEEIGFDWKDWKMYAEWEDSNSIIYFFRSEMNLEGNSLERELINNIMLKKNDVGEDIEFIEIEDIQNEYQIISNLKWLIPLAFKQNNIDNVYVKAYEEAIV